jgi:plasmid stabilization system protein ParE
VALEIRWSEEALASLNALYDYLETEWNEQVLRAFSVKLEEKLKLISKRPALFKASRRLQGTRECILTRHNTIFFTEAKNHIYIVSFWDNRRNARELQ